ncbi:MAG: aldehyde dehydrogenase family protein [Rhodobiaceae bacterium]|nr:aldehyde dehydrogenase family protein [Rhodobiaceae bacterium]MCC0016549.1 aldehyde dehydrogenase family protein [Rhodobiaceae bacterium]MCC0042383.1 aldehyde dehydrogenase family protein [Rhodobiaceae bacterium]
MVETANKPLLVVPDVIRQTASMKLDGARWAAAKLARTGRADIARIVDAVAAAGHAKARHYAEWAVRETGYGVVEHKIMKNEACSKGVVDLYRDEDFVTPRIDASRKMVELPRPAGVVLALVPVTNPVATVFFKTLLSLMTRNAVLLCPHPGAKEVCVDAANTLAEAAKAAGAPDGAIQVIEEPTIPLIEYLMSDERVDLIVATGGPAVVKAAYRSGNPALGVGPGNAPVLVDGTSDIKLAAQRIVASKSFDNSILCTNESVVLAFEAIADRLLAEMKACKAHICTPEETAKVRKLLFTDTGFNGAVIGKDAGWIAREAGFSANGAKILVTPVDLVQPEEKLVREKLCPVLAFARVGGIDQAVSCARSMMRKTGRGHSAAAHSNDENNILAFAAAVPALRIAVNAGCSLGASGFETNLGPSMTIGTGFAGGSSIGDNLTPHHFVQFARIAYNKEASVSFGAFEGRDPLNLPRAAAGPVVQPQLQLHSGGLDADAMRQELRKIILEELNAVLAA